MAEQIIRSGVPTSGRVTPASFPFYTTGEDSLRISVVNSAPSVSLRINARTLSDAGQTTPNSWDHTPTIDRATSVSDFPLSGRTLLNITVFANKGAPQIGQTFVVVQLIRGLGVSALVMGTICQGYITRAQAVAWPGSVIQTSFEGPGCIRTIQQTAPAPGGDMAETVPSGARWQLLSWCMDLVTDASVIVRYPILAIFTGGRYSGFFPLVSGVNASKDVRISWGIGLTGAVPAPDTYFSAGLPSDTPLAAGTQIQTNTVNLQAGDVCFARNFVVREWLEVD